MAEGDAEGSLDRDREESMDDDVEITYEVSLRRSASRVVSDVSLSLFPPVRCDPRLVHRRHCLHSVCQRVGCVVALRFKLWQCNAVE
jgi:hypothetical protein